MSGAASASTDPSSEACTNPADVLPGTRLEVEHRPTEGGVILDITGLNRVLEIGPGWVRVQAGVVKDQHNAALKSAGRACIVK